MPVIINNFEVVPETPASARGAAGSGEAPTAQPRAASAPSPHDIERILRRQAERRARVWAH